MECPDEHSHKLSGVKMVIASPGDSLSIAALSVKMKSRKAKVAQRDGRTGIRINLSFFREAIKSGNKQRQRDRNVYGSGELTRGPCLCRLRRCFPLNDCV